MNVTFALVLAKALHCPHIWIGRALLVGFPITGIMEITGVLRACEERQDPDTFLESRERTLAGNLAWLHEVHRKAKYRAESALSQAQPGAGDGLEIL
jgi:hypothetical protein